MIPPPTGQRETYHPGSAGSAPAPSTPPPGQCGRPGSGVVKCTPQYSIPHFNQHVKGFYSAINDPTQLVNVGCLLKHCDQGSWFHIMGSVVFENGGKLNPHNFTQILQVSTQSKITVFIKPFYQPEIRLDLVADSIAGQVNGNVAALNFRDSTGRVTLDGEIRPNDNNEMVFSAPFRYENFIVFDGTSPGYDGVVGLFEIPACDFFDCA